MATTIVTIESFEPYRYHVPPGDRFAGSLQILLPHTRVTVADVTPPGFEHVGMGRVLAVSDAGPRPTIDLEGGIARADLVAFLDGARETLQEIWTIHQGKLDEYGPLLGNVFER